MSASQKLNNKQVVFREMVLGTLLYSVVLGFFNDYTSLLYTKSYSTTFAAAIVLQLLTYLTLLLKDKVVIWIRKKNQGSDKKVLIGFSIWLIVFLSKFVFLEVLDIVLGHNIDISGFVGLLLIVVTLTIAQKLVELVFEKLGD